MRCESFISKSENLKKFISESDTLKKKTSKTAIRKLFWKIAVRVVFSNANKKQKLSFLQAKMNQNVVFLLHKFFQDLFFSEKNQFKKCKILKALMQNLTGLEFDFRIWHAIIVSIQNLIENWKIWSQSCILKMQTKWQNSRLFRLSRIRGTFEIVFLNLTLWKTFNSESDTLEVSTQKLIFRKLSVSIVHLRNASRMQKLPFVQKEEDSNFFIPYLFCKNWLFGNEIKIQTVTRSEKLDLDSDTLLSKNFI